MLPSAESIQIILPVISILFLVVSFYRPIYGVISYFIILNAKLGDMYPALGAIRFEFLAAIVVFVAIFIKGDGWFKALPGQHPLGKPVWVLFFIGMLSVPLSIDTSVAWDNGGYTLLKLMLFYIMIVSSVADRNDLNKIIWAFVLITVWTAYEPITNYLRGVAAQHYMGAVAVGRFGAATGHVALSNTLNQALPITILLALVSKTKKARMVIFGIAAFILLGVVLSKSRGGFVGIVTIAIGMIYLSKNRARASLIAIAIAIPVMFFAGSSYIDHMSTIGDGIHQSRSTHDRYLGLVHGITMMTKRPVIGVGIGCYATARSRYFGYYFYSHNLYGELFGELGLCSFFWFYWMYSVWRYCKNLKLQITDELKDYAFYRAILTGVQFSLILRLIIGNFTHGSFFWFWFYMAALPVCIKSSIDSQLRLQK